MGKGQVGIKFLKLKLKRLLYGMVLNPNSIEDFFNTNPSYEVCLRLLNWLEPQNVKESISEGVTNLSVDDVLNLFTMEIKEGSANFTQFHNRILEPLIFKQIHLSSTETLILLAIFRLTFGYQKESTQIPVSAFTEMTGLDRRNTHRSLKSLRQKRLIVVNNDNTNSLIYRINWNFTQWRCQKRQQRKKAKIVVNNDTGALSIMTPSKDIIIKKDRKNTSYPSRTNTFSTSKNKEPIVTDLVTDGVKDIISFFAKEYERIKGKPYVISWDKNGKLIKGLLKTLSPETIKERVTLAFKDKWLLERGPDIPLFVSSINRLEKSKDRFSGLKYKDLTHLPDRLKPI